jgi:hypothetical protein
MPTTSVGMAPSFPQQKRSNQYLPILRLLRIRHHHRNLPNKLPKFFVVLTPSQTTTYNSKFQIPQEFSCNWATTSAINKENEYYTYLYVFRDQLSDISHTLPPSQALKPKTQEFPKKTLAASPVLTNHCPLTTAHCSQPPPAKMTPKKTHNLRENNRSNFPRTKNLKKPRKID